MLYSVIVVAAMVMIAVVLFFIFSIVIEQKKVLKWQQARIAAEISILENERKRIAGDLHDELCQCCRV